MLVSRWGNSLAVRLPRELVERMGLKAGDEIEVVDAAAGRIAVTKADQRRAALDWVAAQAWDLPPGYRFDRDEANAR